MEELLILVDDDDNAIGAETKLFIHQRGLLHRAFSIFLFDHKGRLLLQQRALSKYHSAGLWTNSCCGHPRWGETTEAAAHRRLQEEMGVCTALRKVFDFTYHADVPGNLIEYEYDHIYAGLLDGEPLANPDEAADWLWIDILPLIHQLKSHPENFTVWFIKIMNHIKENELEGWRQLVSR